MKNNIGIMQGRLVDREIKSRLQSFPWRYWRKEIKLANKNKIKFLEWTLDYNKFDYNPLIKHPKKVFKYLKLNNVQVKTVTADFFMQKPPFLRNNKTSDYLKKLIKIANEIDIKYIIVPLVDNSSIKKKYNEKQIIDYFKSLHTSIKFKKVKILFELDLSPSKLVKFIYKLNKSFGINYDIGNSASYGFNFEDEKKYFHKVFNVHIKDRKINGGSVPLGKGDVEFSKFFLFLKKIKYSGLLILQTYIPKDKLALENTIKNYKFVRKFYEKEK